LLETTQQQDALTLQLQKRQSRVYRNLSTKVKRNMFTLKKSTEHLQDLRDRDMLWDLDAENGFLSYSKMKYVRN